MNTLTLSQVTEWLASLDPESVVYFDSFEPRHGLLEAYLSTQGYTNVAAEYDKVTSEKKTIAKYSTELRNYLYELHHQPVRYVPTVQDLLDFARSRDDWSNVAHGRFFTLDDDAFNLLYESDLRPSFIAWKHIEIIPFRGREYRVRIQVLAASATYTPDPEHSLPYTIIIESREENDDIAWLIPRHHHEDGRVGSGVAPQRTGSGYQFSLSSLADHEHVDLYRTGSGDIFATWQSRDGKLFLTSSVVEA